MISVPESDLVLGVCENAQTKPEATPDKLDLKVKAAF